jgi:acyl carrier protein
MDHGVFRWPARSPQPERSATKVADVLSEFLGAAGCAGYRAGDDLIDDLGLDSMRLGQLVWSLADRLGVELDLDRVWLDELRTVAGIQSYFERSSTGD